MNDIEFNLKKDFSECPGYAAKNKHFHFRHFLDFVVYKDKITGELIHYTKEQKNKMAEQYDRMQRLKDKIFKENKLA